MKLKDYKNDSYEFSKLTSEIARKLSFAGIGIIWLFKTESTTSNFIPNELIFPLILLVLNLIFDLLQYFIPSIIWSSFYIRNEKNGIDQNADIKAKSYYSYPGWLCYYLKLVCLFLAYTLIACFLIGIL